MGASYSPDLGNQKFDPITGKGDDFRGTGLTVQQLMMIIEEIAVAEYPGHVDPVIEVGDNEAELTNYLMGVWLIEWGWALMR